MILGKFIRDEAGRLVNTEYIEEIRLTKYRHPNNATTYRVVAYMAKGSEHDLIAFTDTDPVGNVPAKNRESFWYWLGVRLYQNLATITDYQKYISDYERENIPKYNGRKK